MPSARTILLVDLKEDLAVALADFGLQPVLRAANSVTFYDKMSHTLPASVSALSTIDRDVVDLCSDFAVRVNGDVNQLVDPQIVSRAGSRHQEGVDEGEFIRRATGVGNEVVASGGLIYIPRCESKSTNAHIVKTRRNMHAAISIRGHTEDSMNFANEVDQLSAPCSGARYRDRCGYGDLDLSNDFRATGRRREQRDYCRNQEKGLSFQGIPHSQ